MRACLSFLLLWRIAAGQTVRYPVGAPYITTGVYSVLFSDAFSFTANAAALAGIRKPGAAVYSESRFGLRSLGFYQATACLPAGGGGIGVAVRYFGYAASHQSRLGLAYGKSLGRIDLGIRFNYDQVHIAGYGNDGAVSVEAGSIWSLSKKLRTGIYVVNPVGGHFTKSKSEKLAGSYSVGGGYQASRQVFVGLAINKTENRPVDVQAGWQYAFAGRFFARGGIATAGTRLYIGFGFRWKNIRLELSGSSHPLLGLTPGLLLLFGNPNPEKK